MQDYELEKKRPSMTKKFQEHLITERVIWNMKLGQREDPHVIYRNAQLSHFGNFGICIQNLAENAIYVCQPRTQSQTVAAAVAVAVAVAVGFEAMSGKCNATLIGRSWGV